jgi:holo-[acyl-carrier protein] synthase
VIHGVGVDLVRVARMQGMLDRFGERLALRILAPAELEEFRSTRRPAHFLAKRFAAKEALAKALGTGFRGGLGLRDIGVAHDHLGRPSLTYSPGAREILEHHGVGEAHLSLADEEDHAVAVVALVRRPG